MGNFFGTATSNNGSNNTALSKDEIHEDNGECNLASKSDSFGADHIESAQRTSTDAKMQLSWWMRVPYLLCHLLIKVLMVMSVKQFIGLEFWGGFDLHGGIKPDEDLHIFMKGLALRGQKTNLVVEYILKILDLDICADTLVGDEMLKGISGGQEKRLTTGAYLLSLDLWQSRFFISEVLIDPD
ncbi:hypothetical protein Sjap_019050 [Stephania japonica]|uniref:Uncharacterized protein n=1 Tax=Stephania japonica TaxID=461633 RepID=A0AAP0EY14_9MAGN